MDLLQVALGVSYNDMQKSVPHAPQRGPILVIDVGGTHIKLLATGHDEPRKIPSGPKMTPIKMVRLVKENTQDWRYTRISIGYPGPVTLDHPLRDPHNLGRGWVGFNFAKAFGCPVKVVNDAAMQALGGYRGGRMLFLGLGTGLGAAMIVDSILQPMELAHLPYRKGRTYEDYLGERGLERLGKAKWSRHVLAVVDSLRQALEAEYVVIGGGNVRLLKRLPPSTIRGDNAQAFTGGFRLWDSKTHSLLN